MKKPLFAFAAALVLLQACAGDGQKNNQAAGNVPDGNQLFLNNCASCHSLTEDRTGPALAGTLPRWGNDTAKVIAFVKDPMAVVNAGGKDSYAGQLYDKWHHVPMTSFTGLSDAEIMAVVKYVNAGK